MSEGFGGTASRWATGPRAADMRSWVTGAGGGSVEARVRSAAMCDKSDAIEAAILDGLAQLWDSPVRPIPLGQLAGRA